MKCVGEMEVLVLRFLGAPIPRPATTTKTQPLMMVHVLNWTNAASVEVKALPLANVTARAMCWTSVACAVVKALPPVNATVMAT